MYSDLCQPWPLIWCGDITGINPEVTGSAHLAASEILWEATGRRFGNCDVSVRPCRRECSSHWPQDVLWSDGVLTRGNWGWPYPSLVNGVWLNAACGICTGDCSCKTTSEVLLSERIDTIVSMTIDGASLIQNVDYIVYDAQRLVRAGGAQWPMCQDWTATGGPGTWVINVAFGSPVPRLGQMATGVLTLEIAKLCCGQPCNLPPSVQRVVRQGVTMERLSPRDVLVDGFTGLWIPDQFIQSVNPTFKAGGAVHRLRDRARAYSVDDIQARIQG